MKKYMQALGFTAVFFMVGLIGFFLTTTLTSAQEFDPLGGLSSGFEGGDDEPAATDAETETGSVSDLFEDETPQDDTGASEDETSDDRQKNKDEDGTADEDGATKDSAEFSNEETEGTQDEEATEPTDEVALTIAECIIFEQLEIEDKRCDELFGTVSCEEYTACVTSCQGTKRSCYVNCDTLQDECKECRYEYNQCVKSCGVTHNDCPAATEPPENAHTGPLFSLQEAIGDVRVTYENDPRAVDMMSVEDVGKFEVGAAIYTGEYSGVTMILPNGAVQYIGPNSYFRIADYYESDTLDETTTILGNGSARIKLEGTRGRHTSYTTITPVGKYEARGTEFELTVTEDGATTVNTTEGTVIVLTHNDTVLAQVGAGEKLTQTSDGELTDYSSGVEFPNSQRSFVNAYGIIAIVIVVAVILIIVFLIIRRRKQ